MKKPIFLLFVPLVSLFSLSAQVTQEQADQIAIERMSNDASFYILYAKADVQTGFEITTFFGETIELEYPAWVYYVNFIGTTHGKYLIVKENTGNVLEVNTKNDAGPDDWEDWRLLLEFTLKDTGWKLEGVVDLETGILTPLEPTESGWWGNINNIYKLIFNNTTPIQLPDTLSILSGRGVLNIFLAEYEIDYSKNNIHILWLVSTAVGEFNFDEDLYFEYLRNIYYFSIQDNKLMLYFNELNYLLFKLIES